jgi:CRISP-associated protein Cas1
VRSVLSAILNYAYAVLESQVRIAATAHGLDPTIGYLHARRPGRVALVYDLMEPFRPRVDAQILELLRGHVFAPSDFLMDRRGACRLHPQLARVVAKICAADTEISDRAGQVAGLFAGTVQSIADLELSHSTK